MAEKNIEKLLDCTVIDQDGNKIGAVGQVYLDDKTGQATWVTVKTGLFGLKETFAPLHKAVLNEDTIQLPYSKDKVKDAPRVEPDKHLDAAEEANLYNYYDIWAVDSVSKVESAIAEKVAAEHQDQADEAASELAEAQREQAEARREQAEADRKAQVAAQALAAESQAQSTETEAVEFETEQTDTTQPSDIADGVDPKEDLPDGVTVVVDESVAAQAADSGEAITEVDDGSVEEHVVEDQQTQQADQQASSEVQDQLPDGVQIVVDESAANLDEDQN